MQSIFNYGYVDFDRISEIFNNISIALTNYMRENGGSQGSGNGSAPAIGTVKQTLTCVGIQCAWLIYPTALVFCTWAFSILLVVETWHATSWLGIWKSSPLALLYHGLEDHLVRDSYSRDWSSTQEVEGMKDVARSTSVKLEGSTERPIQFIHERRVVAADKNPR